MNEGSEFKSKGDDLLLWILTVALLIFTGFRSVHLIQSTLPPDWAIVGYAALAALDGGLLLWLRFYTHRAMGPQKTVAALMIAVDFVGVMAALLADTFLVAGGDEGLVTVVATWVVPIVVSLNILGKVTVTMLDPSQMVREAQAEATAAMAASEAAMYTAIAKQRKLNAAPLAAEVAPDVYEGDEAAMRARFGQHGKRAGLDEGRLAAALAGLMGRAKPRGEAATVAKDSPIEGHVRVARPVSRRLKARTAQARANLNGQGPK